MTADHAYEPAADGEARPAPTGRRATSYDVARAAGVSQSAVSRCFAPGGSISAQTRERVTRAASALGYRPNALAQGLISGRSNLVAILISNLTNLHYPEVLSELTGRLTQRNMRVLLFALNAESDLDESLDQIFRHSVDGVISAVRLSGGQIRAFEANRVPLVLYNRAGDQAAASISCDSVAGERELVVRLLMAGHQRFGLIAGPEDSWVGEERRRAVSECLAEARLGDFPMVRGDFSYESGAQGLRLLMAQRPDLEAVVCVSDLMAIGVIDAARGSFGLKVPDDLSVVGFDGSSPAGWASYRVTSIRQPVSEMTEAAISMLMQRLEDPTISAEHRLFGGEFILGGSARIV
jgi:DNA-binding LacI/PurR family transcriptional regulator